MKNKKKKILIIAVGIFVIIGISFIAINPSIMMNDKEKANKIVEVFKKDGIVAANSKIEELYKFDKNKQDAYKKALALQSEKIFKGKQQREVRSSESKLNVNDFEITNIKADRDESQRYINVTGTIKNNGKIPTRYYEIYVDFYNKNGSIIETDRTNSTISLQPNASNTFKIMAHCQDGIKDCKVYVHEVH